MRLNLRFVTLLIVAASLSTIRAAPRPPLPPLPELVRASFSEHFDAEFHAGGREAELGTPEGYKLVESFSGYALQRTGPVVPFVIDGVLENGHTNLFPNGAIRLWVKPYWSSASTGEGQGPGQVAQVLEMSIVGKGQSAPVWNLEISADGSVIMLQGVAAGAKEPGVLLRAEIAWRAGEWHQVLLNHTEQATTLILDGATVTDGAGVIAVPPHAAALTVASRLAGTEGFAGEVEEVFCFVRPLTTAFHWFPYKDVAILGPISAEEMAYRAELAEKWKARKALRDKEAEESGGGMMLRMSGPSANCVTNGPVYLTNALVTVTTNDGWTIYFDIAGGTNEVVYDIFSTPELTGGDITNSIWTWLETGKTCETHYFTNQATNQTFYILTVPGADRDGDGIYDGWEWKHFGTLAQTAAGDYDGNGETNGVAYASSDGDPNQIRFALGFGTAHVNGNSIAGSIIVLQGVPESMAVLVNSTNFESAVWQPFQTNVMASLGGSDGEYVVWVGLRGHAWDAERAWHAVTITRDTVAPQLFVTHPVSNLTAHPVLQLQGYGNEPLLSVRYDITNVAGLLTNLTGYVTTQYLDTNALSFTTNWFQCYDVALATNSNTLTLRITDLAGNVTTTNLNLTLDYSSDTNAPSIAVAWPDDYALVAGTNFTLRGQLDEATATISVSIGSNTISGSVDRNGNFEVPGVPMESATNVLTVSAIDAAGNTNTLAHTVRKSAETLTIDPVSPSQLTQPTVTVTGTVGVSGQSVWVNGVAASVSGNTWTATISTPSGGVANIDVKTGSSPTTPTAVQTLSVESPPQVRAVSFTENYILWDSAGCGVESRYTTRTRTWLLGVGGSSKQSFEHAALGQSCHTFVAWPSSWPGDQILAGTNCSGSTHYEQGVFAWQNCDDGEARAEFHPLPNDCPEAYVSRSTARRIAETKIELHAGGSGGEPKLIRLTASAAAYEGVFAGLFSTVSLNDTASFSGPGEATLPVSTIRILGQSLTPTITNANVGELFITQTAGTTRDLPVAVIGANNYSFEVHAEEVKVDLIWTNVADNPLIEGNNNPITGVPMPGGGKRIFVGAKTPTENNLRNTNALQFRISPPIANLRIYFRAFDVDDPSSDSVIDPNGAEGNDNLGSPTAYGIFPATGIRDIYADTDTNGVAIVMFQVGPQPGNNYRVAAGLESADVFSLNVYASGSPRYIPANDNQIAAFAGRLSPMLTVWRKLHLEVDSMEAVATSGAEANSETGTVLYSHADIPVSGQSRITTQSTLRGYGYNNAYENGRMEITGYSPFQILSNEFNIDINGTPFYYLYIVGTPGTNIQGQTFTLYDDDDRFLSTISLPPALPKDDESTNIVQGIRAAFFPAYIDVTNANAMGLNPNKQIAFKRNEPIIGIGFTSIFDDSKNLIDTEHFWAHTLAFGYQPGSSEDGDPDFESGGEPLRGGTPKSLFGTSQGYSVVFIEAIRDRTFRNLNESLFINPATHAAYRELFSEELYGTIAHEIGHSPGGHTESTDHAELGLMIVGGAAIDVEMFAPVTIKRFRTAGRWLE